MKNDIICTTPRSTLTHKKFKIINNNNNNHEKKKKSLKKSTEMKSKTIKSINRQNFTYVQVRDNDDDNFLIFGLFVYNII